MEIKNFTDITNPDLGGTIDLLLDGTEGHVSLDNMCFDNYGHIILLEDVGGNAHSGKIWQYTVASDQLKLLTKHDSDRFGDVSNGVVQNATLPFTNDEEASGIIDMSAILGAGNFLLVDQAHYNIGDTEAVEGGQLLKLFNPDSYNASLSTNTFTTGVADFEVAAYPNPYDTAFQISFETTSEDQIEIKVYDMIGKLIEEHKLNTAAINNKKIGINFESGIYNVSLTQGANTRTLRVIKK